ncbi:putative motility protein [Tumebacillus lipolyticus]|uniref:Motility protein n=1 Tax=Tumebacillus lipolyticus TaxID=1280370 RepID=A0ABW4ZT87_9BACL
MEVSSVSQAVNLWALKQAMNMGQSQAPAQLQIVNQLASLDPMRGQMIDIRV